MTQSSTRRPARLATLTAAAAAFALLLAGCSGAENGDDASATETDSLAVITPAPFASWDPTAIFTPYGGGLYTQAVYDTLVKESADGEFEPSLATEWTYDDALTTLTMDLRTDVTFTDGTPFDAAAVRARFPALADATGGGPLSASAGPSTGGFVQADPSTNSLIITAAEPLYRQVRAVIEQLDARRAQIYVESLIVKIDNTKAGQFGVQWQNLFGKSGDSTITGAGTNFGSGLSNIINATGTLAQGTTAVGTAIATGGAPTGLNIGVLKKFGSIYTLGAVANFFESQSGANVLSTPNLVALDNEEARIVIGQNVPFVTGSYANTGTTGGTVNPFTTVDRKDVGLTLKIKSQIGEGGTVRMQVSHENSSVVPGSSGTQGPTLDKSAIDTSVVVDDGDIIVLGGLLKDEYTDGDDGVPGLSKIPVLGNLFGSKNRRRVKTNLMVFLRPVVLRSAEGSSKLSLDRYESIRAVQQLTQPTQNVLLPDTGAPVLPDAKPSATTAPVALPQPQ